MRIRSIKIRNYKSLQDVEMKDMPGFAVLVGANGVGKSTLIDVFNFLKDALKNDMRVALRRRGGFQQVVSRGHENEPIEITLEFEASGRRKTDKGISNYHVSVSELKDGKININQEILDFRSGPNDAHRRSIVFENGKIASVSELPGIVGIGSDFGPSFHEILQHILQLDAPCIPALKSIGHFKPFAAAIQLRDLIENWQVFDLHIADARKEPDAETAEHLNSDGGNIALYAQYLREEHEDIFAEIIDDMERCVPGTSNVDAVEPGDGRIALGFRDQAFEKGFPARAVSDGTMRMFAYLALLKDPNPPPLLCIEGPENQLYPTLLSALAEEFAAHAKRREGKGQVFVATHSPDFLNHVPLESIYWLEKRDGFSKLRRASDDSQLAALVNEGDRPGSLWRHNLFQGANP